MKRFIQFFAVVGVIVGLMYAVRWVRHEHARTVALPVIASLGGRVTSIPAFPGGTEYYISFADCSLSRKDIDQLAVLNALARNWNYVSVSLNDARISSEDREYLQQTLPEVHVLPVETEAREKPAA